MPGYVPLSVGQPYMDAVSAIASKTGDWIQLGEGLDVLCFEYVFAMGAGNITGTITVAHTGLMNGTPAAGTTILLPLGSLHTSLTTATLASAPNPSTAVTLTALTTGRIEIMLANVPPGQIRSVYTFTSGTGASPNTLTTYATGFRR